MIPNPDIYHEISGEFINLTRNNPRSMLKYMLLGKEPLNALKSFAARTEFVYFKVWLNKEYKYDSTCASYQLIPESSDRPWSDINLRDPYMRQILQWILSFVKEINVYIYDPLPEYVVDLLLKNPYFKKIELYECDVSATNRLLGSKRFDSIKIWPNTIENLKDTHIDAKDLTLYGISLEKGLGLKITYVNSLTVIDYINNDRFDSSFLITSVDPGFQSLERLKLEIGSLHGSKIDQSVNPQRVLEFLGFVNMNLVNLKLLEIHLGDYNIENTIVIHEGNFKISPHSIKSMVDYENELAAYNGRVKVIFNHKIRFNMRLSSDNAVEDYLKEAKGELKGFEYCPDIKCWGSYHEFKKFGNITENFELNLEIKFEYHKRSQ
ncbi:hypothetical protein FO519_002446 [Halicephalobus sp. NKZ332]|nr:hypothetical protein FO519_002446 [Halicephalobus sp. NKZ332]